MNIQDTMGVTSGVKAAIRVAARSIAEAFLRRFRWNEVGSNASPGQDWVQRARIGTWMTARKSCPQVEPSHITLCESELFYQYLNTDVPAETRSQWASSTPLVVAEHCPLVSYRLDMTPSDDRLRAMQQQSSFPFALDEEMWEKVLWWRAEQPTLDLRDSILQYHAMDMVENYPSETFSQLCCKTDKSGRLYWDDRSAGVASSKALRAAFSCGEDRPFHPSQTKAYTSWCLRLSGMSSASDFCKLHTEWKEALKAGHSLYVIRHSRQLAAIMAGATVANSLWEGDMASSGTTMILGMLNMLKDVHCNILNPDWVHPHEVLTRALVNACVHARGASNAEVLRRAKQLANPAQYGAAEVPVSEAYLGIEYDKGSKSWKLDDDTELVIPDLFKSLVEGMPTHTRIDPDTGEEVQVRNPQDVCDKVMEKTKRYLSTYHRVFPFVRKYNQAVRKAVAESMDRGGCVFGSGQWQRELDPFTYDPRDLDHHSVKAWNKRFEEMNSCSVFTLFENDSWTAEASAGAHGCDSGWACAVTDECYTDHDTPVITVHDAVLGGPGDEPVIHKAARNGLVKIFSDPSQQLLVRLGIIDPANWSAPKLDDDAQIIR
jgi:hypothetical protein